MTVQNKRLSLILGTIAAMLMVPFIAMQFTSEVNWSAGDFLVAAILLTGAGLGIELVLRMVGSRRNRLIICAFILLLLLLVWAELAVGIFGTPFAGS